MIWIGILVGTIVYGLYLLFRCGFRVEQGYLAVLTNFGAAINKPGSKDLLTYEPGMHWKWPWQNVHQVAMMEQNLELSGEEGGRTAMAKDGTVLRFDSILRFVPVESELEEFLFDLRSPHEHITGLFTCLLRNEIADFHPMAEGNGNGNGASLELPGSTAPTDPSTGGSYALIRRQRRQLNERIEEFCQKEIGKRYGVKFSAVDLTDILPPDELADALNAVMNAQTEADGHYSHAEAESQQRLLAAERGVAIAGARALAVEREIETLGRFLDDLHRQGTLEFYVARRRAEVLAQSRTLFLRSHS
ncbi:MAG: SPFH domain-containing protein [Myxococcales bacterium]|nr:SPFH domain-containing protein [Myxococcales bacterium]